MVKKYQNIDSSIKYSIASLFGFLVASISFLTINPPENQKPILSAALGALAGLAVPLWQTYFVNRSKLSLEVSSISRKVSKKSEIYLDEHSEFSVMKKNAEDENSGLFLVLNQSDLKKNPLAELMSKSLKISLQDARKSLKICPQKSKREKKILKKFRHIGPNHSVSMIVRF